MFSVPGVLQRSGGRALAIACIVAAVSISGVAAKGQNQNPFKGTVNETFNAYSCGLLFCAASSGSGNISQAGKVTSSFLGIVDFSKSPSRGCYIENSTGTLTTANGDQIFIADNNGTFCLTSAGGVVTGTFSVTGGTGRFNGATGGGNYSATTTFNDASMSGGSSVETYTGTISKPGNNGNGGSGDR